MKNAIVVALVAAVALFVVYQNDPSLFGLFPQWDGFQNAPSHGEQETPGSHAASGSEQAKMNAQKKSGKEAFEDKKEKFQNHGDKKKEGYEDKKKEGYMNEEEKKKEYAHFHYQHSRRHLAKFVLISWGTASLIKQGTMLVRAAMSSFYQCFTNVLAVCLLACALFNECRVKADSVYLMKGR